MSQNRPEKLVAELKISRLAGELFGRRGGSWPSAIGDLLDTPRALKFSLNAIRKTWQRIHGEVDIDELIILTALRYRAGEVYSFLVRRSADVRRLGRQSSLETESDKKEKQRQIDELRDEWKEVLSRTDANLRAVEVLVGDVFPSSQSITGRALWQHSNRLQSVNSRRGDVYMDRIAAGDIASGSVRDQTVLRHLDVVARGESVEEFANAFVTSREFGELAIFFDEALRSWRTQPRVESQERLAVASAMIRIEEEQAGENLLYQIPTHHLIQQWISNAANDQYFIAWAENEVLSRIPHGLIRATELYFDLFRDLRISVESQSITRRKIAEKARDAFLRMLPSEFATCFPSHFPYTLAHLLRLDSKQPSEQLLTRLEDWTWLEPQLLAALAERPDIMVPHVLPVFGSFGPHPGPFEHYKFDDTAVGRFFGPDRERFYRLVSEPFDRPGKLDANFQRLLPLAVEQAKLVLRATDAEWN
jgi:hypothetical protein